MPCYKSGGCGQFESLSCSECPASKPEYALVHNNENHDKFEPTESNEFLHLLDNPILKTDNVNRFSGTYQANPEILSVHIVDVQFISFIIARKLIGFGEYVDIGKLLEKGLVHDVDETLTGDFTRLVKYSSKECHDALEAVAESVTLEISQKTDGTSYIYDIWANAKDNTIEGYIIRIADILSVIKKVSKEVDMLGNNHFLRVALEVQSYINDLYKTIPADLMFMPSSIKYIKSLFKGVINYLSDITSKRSEVIESLNIDNSTVKYIVNNRYNKAE